MDKKRLYHLLYEWTINETCDCCEHITTFYDGDRRHPCNRCEAYELFKLSKELDKDLKDKVKQVIEITKEETK